MKITWKKVKWPYNNEKPYCDWVCWKYKKVILYPGQWPNMGWSYVRTGANSENAHSGFLPGYAALEAAKRRVLELIEEGKIIP